MTRRFLSLRWTSLFVALAAAATFSTPQLSSAALGDCGQPLSGGDDPTASDALYILNAAVGLQMCDPQCVCDPNNSGSVTAVDAVTILNKAVGVEVPLLCPCGPTTTTTTLPGLPCTSAEFFARLGSDLDSGWKGTGHDSDIIDGASITFGVLRRCSNGSICTTDDDCGGGEGSCALTCNCNGGDTECEIAGPTVEPTCIGNLAVPCSTNSECTSAGAGDQCVRFFGPPLPLTASGTPVCVTSYFEDDLTGTADSATGEGEASARLRSRVHLGIDLNTPCPRCGRLDQGAQGSLQVGEMYTCEGGPNQGMACTVDGISPDFGGVSSDCPPATNTNVSGVGLNIKLDVTTGSASEQALVPCGNPFNDFHPNSGNAFCLDTFAACDTNADCAGATCGLYCHCGFCDEGSGPDPDLPCFSDADCETGTCSSDPNNSNLNQAQPNGCESFVCGEVTPEQCCTSDDGAACPNPSNRVGECDVVAAACANNSECVIGGNGTECLLTPRPCFENVITRTGVPSALGRYCIDDLDTAACTTNADCMVGECVGDTAEPTTAALFCIPATASSAINSAAGTPGAGAIEFRSVVVTCRCGDGDMGCDEQCDDGNLVSGDGCDKYCRTE